MPIDYPFRTSPQLGPGLTYADSDPWYDPINITEPSYQLGQIHQGSDGFDYIWVEAGGTLAAEATVTIDDATFVATAGAGGWSVPAELTDGVTAGVYFHAKRDTL